MRFGEKIHVYMDVWMDVRMRMGGRIARQGASRGAKPFAVPRPGVPYAARGRRAGPGLGLAQLRHLAQLLAVLCAAVAPPFHRLAVGAGDGRAVGAHKPLLAFFGGLLADEHARLVLSRSARLGVPIHREE